MPLLLLRRAADAATDLVTFLPGDLPVNPIDITPAELYELLTKGYQSEGPKRAATRAYFKHVEGLLETNRLADIARTLFALIRVIESRAVEYNLLTDPDMQIRKQQALQAGYEYVALILLQMFISKPNETIEVIARHMVQQDQAGDSAHTLGVFAALIDIRGYSDYFYIKNFIELFKQRAPLLSSRFHFYFENELDKNKLRESTTQRRQFRSMSDPVIQAINYFVTPIMTIAVLASTKSLWATIGVPGIIWLEIWLLNYFNQRKQNTEISRLAELESITPTSLKKEAETANAARTPMLTEQAPEDAVDLRAREAVIVQKGKASQ